MPKWERHLFPVATMTIVAIAGIGFLVRAAKPYLPPDKANELANESAAYLLQGSHQQIQWRKFGVQAFEEAKKSGKPVMMMMGSEWSALGRQCDREVLSDPDVEAFLSRYMVCVRLDLDESPQWRSLFLPFLKARTMHDPAFQIVFINTNGEPYLDGGTLGFGPPMNGIEFMGLLQSALNRFQSTGPEGTGELQANMALALRSLSNGGQPNFDAQLSSTIRMIDSKSGAIRLRGFSSPEPNALRFLLHSFAFEHFQQTADALIKSNLVDWLDGGFFYQIEAGGRKATRFDKVSTINAETMEVLAEAGALFDKPVYSDVARRTFDWLANDAAINGIPVSARLGDETANGRSNRCSIPVRNIRELIESPSDREFARDYLGLRVEKNPMMTVNLPEPEILQTQSAKVESLLSLLRKSQSQKNSYSSRQFCDVAGNVAARLQRAVVLLDSPDRQPKIDAIWQALQQFRFGVNVEHELHPNGPIEPYLGDYLAMVDACLSRFLATGDPEAFDLGLQVLERTETLFSSEVPGVWISHHFSKDSTGIDAAELPEILDSSVQSQSAQAIRLCLSFGRLLRDARQGADNSSAQKWSQIADTMVRHFASQSENIAFSGSAYFSSALDWDRRIHAITVGPQAVQLANRFSRKAPFLLVAPAKGRVRPGLQNGKPGIYLVHIADVSGPFTEEEALVQLGNYLKARQQNGQP